MAGRRRTVTWLVGVAVLAAPASAGAQGGVQYPMLAMQPSGTAHAGWVDYDGGANLVQERRRSTTGSLGPAQWVSPASAYAQQPAMTVDATGNAHFAWVAIVGDVYAIQARRRSADGTLHPVQTLSAAGRSAEGPQLAADPNGGAIFVWHEETPSGRVIKLRRRTSTGALTATQTLSTDGYFSYRPRVSVGATGEAVVAWIRGSSAPDSAVVQMRHRAANGTLSALQNLSTPGRLGNQVRVGLDGAGNAVAAWRRYDGAHYRVQARRRAANATLSTTVNVSPGGEATEELDLAMDPDGDAFMVWIARVGNGDLVRLRRRGPDGSLSTLQSLSVPAEGAMASGADVEVDPAGNAIAAWSGDSGTGTRVQARRRTAAGALSTVQDLSAASSAGIQPVVGVDRNGHAVFVWLQAIDGGADYILQTRRRVTTGELSEIQTLSS